MGSIVGPTVGAREDTVGPLVGEMELGIIDGTAVGPGDGRRVGAKDGTLVGTAEGSAVVGDTVGDDGARVGNLDGLMVGTRDGRNGLAVGISVGNGDGSGVVK